MFVGGALSGAPILAIAAIALLAAASALLAARSRLGLLAMTLSLPMVGVGLSFTDLADAATLAGLMVAGSLFAWLLSLAWPERAPPARPATEPIRPTLGYGIRLGAAGATAAAIGFLLDLEHVGWACAAALMVMRPAAEMQRLRSTGRILAGAAGTRRSRWYVMSAFTTFLVFLLLLYSDPGAAGARFGERLSETLLGVALAYGFGLALPAALRRRPGRPPPRDPRD